MSLIELIEFPTFVDDRGTLVALEANRQIPFVVNRVYFIYGANPSVARGFHAHRELRQLAICLVGSCRIVMDDGKSKEQVILNSPKRGLVIAPMQWHEMYDFSADCVLMVLADKVYDERDYIRFYEDFLSISGKCSEAI